MKNRIFLGGTAYIDSELNRTAKVINYSFT